MLKDSATITSLQQTHSEYEYYKDTWQTIQDIREGASTILKKIRSYLPQRPGEDEALYRLRLAKASWTPVMSTAIREFVVKMLSAPIHLGGVDGVFWQRFKDDTNGKGRDESDLLTQIFSDVLYYGRCHVAIDRAILPILPRSKFEEKLVNAIPKVVLYSPLAVINWGDGWLITREIETKAEPLEKPKTITTWRVWTSVGIYTYSQEVKLKDGIIEAVWINNAWLPASHPDAIAPLVSTVDHKLGSLPVLSLQLPNELWTGNNCYLKQLQHFAIESSWTDAGIMAGTIQRIFTPTPPVASNDPSVVYDEPDYGNLKADNQHILIGNGFQFVESSGSAITSLTSQLDKIELQIRAIVSMSDSTVDGTAKAQSGVSKAIDREPLEDTMKAYGTKIASLYQDILQMVARAANINTDISVSGLDSYSTNTLSDMLEQCGKLPDIYKALPPTALKLWFGKLANLLAGSRSAELENSINSELDGLWASGLPSELLPKEPLTDV